MLLQAKLSSKCFMLLFYLIFSILRNMYFIPILQITEHKEVKQVAQGHGKVAIQDRSHKLQGTAKKEKILRLTESGCKFKQNTNLN